jgi:hypothetical protein
VDINTLDSGIFKDSFLRELLAASPYLVLLIRIIKKWARTCGLNDPKQGTLNSYCLGLLCTFHLQTLSVPRLPPTWKLLPGGSGADPPPSVARPMHNGIRPATGVLDCIRDAVAALRAVTPPPTAPLDELVFSFFIHIGAFALHRLDGCGASMALSSWAGSYTTSQDGKQAAGSTAWSTQPVTTILELLQGLLVKLHSAWDSSSAVQQLPNAFWHLCTCAEQTLLDTAAAEALWGTCRSLGEGFEEAAESQWRAGQPQSGRAGSLGKATVAEVRKNLQRALTRIQASAQVVAQTAGLQDCRRDRYDGRWVLKRRGSGGMTGGPAEEGAGDSERGVAAEALHGIEGWAEGAREAESGLELCARRGSHNSEEDDLILNMDVDEIKAPQSLDTPPAAPRHEPVRVGTPSEQHSAASTDTGVTEPLADEACPPDRGSPLEPTFQCDVGDTAGSGNASPASLGAQTSARHQYPLFVEDPFNEADNAARSLRPSHLPRLALEALTIGLCGLVALRPCAHGPEPKLVQLQQLDQLRSRLDRVSQFTPPIPEMSDLARAVRELSVAWLATVPAAGEHHKDVKLRQTLKRLHRKGLVATQKNMGRDEAVTAALVAVDLDSGAWGEEWEAAQASRGGAGQQLGGHGRQPGPSLPGMQPGGVFERGVRGPAARPHVAACKPSQGSPGPGARTQAAAGGHRVHTDRGGQWQPQATIQKATSSLMLLRVPKSMDRGHRSAGSARGGAIALAAPRWQRGQHHADDVAAVDVNSVAWREEWEAAHASVRGGRGQGRGGRGRLPGPGPPRVGPGDVFDRGVRGRAGADHVGACDLAQGPSGRGAHTQTAAGGRSGHHDHGGERQTQAAIQKATGGLMRLPQSVDRAHRGAGSASVSAAPRLQKGEHHADEVVAAAAVEVDSIAWGEQWEAAQTFVRGGKGQGRGGRGRQPGPGPPGVALGDVFECGVRGRVGSTHVSACKLGSSGRGARTQVAAGSHRGCGSNVDGLRQPSIEVQEAMTGAGFVSLPASNRGDRGERRARRGASTSVTPGRPRRPRGTHHRGTSRPQPPGADAAQAGAPCPVAEGCHSEDVLVCPLLDPWIDDVLSASRSSVFEPEHMQDVLTPGASSGGNTPGALAHYQRPSSSGWRGRWPCVATEPFGCLQVRLHEDDGTACWELCTSPSPCRVGQPLGEAAIDTDASEPTLHVEPQPPTPRLSANNPVRSTPSALDSSAAEAVLDAALQQLSISQHLVSTVSPPATASEQQASFPSDGKGCWVPLPSTPEPGLDAVAPSQLSQRAKKTQSRRCLKGSSR